MGTLYNQEVRNDHGYDLEDFLMDAQRIARDRGLTVTDVIAAVHVLERRRRNDMYRSNGDTFDEQMAGFGQILEKISDGLEDIAGALGGRRVSARGRETGS